MLEPQVGGGKLTFVKDWDYGTASACDDEYEYDFYGPEKTYGNWPK